MPVNLEGGCRVIDMREGEAVEHGTLRIWSPIGRRTGAQAISLRVLEFAPGTSPGFRNETCDETFYVLERDEAEVAREDPTPQALTVFIDGCRLVLQLKREFYFVPVRPSLSRIAKIIRWF